MGDLNINIIKRLVKLTCFFCVTALISPVAESPKLINNIGISPTSRLSSNTPTSRIVPKAKAKWTSYLFSFVRNQSIG